MESRQGNEKEWGAGCGITAAMGLQFLIVLILQLIPPGMIFFGLVQFVVLGCVFVWARSQRLRAFATTVIIMATMGVILGGVGVVLILAT